MKIRVTDIPEKEIVFSAIRARGPGGQHVNKTSTAVQLKFDVLSSTLPKAIRDDLLKLRDSRITSKGLVVIKADNFRSRENNKRDAIERLNQLLSLAHEEKILRKKTRPTLSSRKKRLESKKKRGDLKKSRKKIED
ncbi:MAG: class I peptide chain release factor [Gammaproteobacteria bacterium]|nr:class I peptide chain release factor [Gammaproteobacteria bacterium]|tara:strand:+ start:171 stop:578 length:408 start_codon:yes stop_codon:yes gene_type:complete